MRELRSGAADAYTFAANRAVSRISLAVQVSRGATRRKHVEEVGSLRVRFPTPSAADLEAVIINTAGGVAGGDRLHIAIDVSDGARLLVTSAAAEKVYRSLGPDAHITARLKLGAESALGWLPQEMIMFNRARLRRCIEVDMAEGAQLMLAETSIFGRAAMGECLATGTLFDRWRFRREGRLLFGETLKLYPRFK
jgi:urease accessory protein